MNPMTSGAGSVPVTIIGLVGGGVELVGAGGGGVVDCAVALPADAASTARVSDRVRLRTVWFFIGESPFPRRLSAGRRLESKNTRSDRITPFVT